jgi:hypothetical protein
VAQSPWEGYVIEPYTDAQDLDTDEKIEAYVRKFAGTNRHAVSSASIGTADEGSAGVVGPDLKVKGVENLRVVDASVIVSDLVFQVLHEVLTEWICGKLSLMQLLDSRKPKCTLSRKELPL